MSWDTACPDADSFGAAIGIYRAAKTLNKKAYIVIDNPTSSIIPLMNTFRDNQDYEADMFVNNHEAKEIMDDNTLLVVVDTNKPSITQCEDLLYMAKMIVVAGSSPAGKRYDPQLVLSYIEPYASSASEMVAEILQYFTEGIRIRNVEADQHLCRHHDRYRQLYAENRCPHVRGGSVPAPLRCGCDACAQAVP